MAGDFEEPALTAYEQRVREHAEQFPTDPDLLHPDPDVRDYPGWRAERESSEQLRDRLS